MLGGAFGWSVFLMIVFAGCLEAKPELKTVPDAIPKYVGELPKIYISTGELLDPNYDQPDFPRVVQVLLGARGGEPNIGVTSQGGIFVTAFDSTMRSMDGGKTWENVYEFEAAPGAPADPFDTGDPMLWVDTDTDRIFTNHMFPALGCSSQIYSDDNGESWLHFPMSCGLPVVDHQKLATARIRAPAVATPLYENAVYYCYNKLLTTNCAVSFDGGIRYAYDNVVATGFTQCGGINGHPTPAPDGTMYVPLGLNCNTPGVAITQDNGLTWTVRMFGSLGEKTGQQEIDPEITVTPDGTAYYYGRGADGNGYLWRSKDSFTTIDGPFRVNAPDVKGVIFAAMASGSDGKLAIAYLGNREWAGDPSEAPDNTTWHLFVTNSYDAGAGTPTFSTHQVTPNSDPVQIGCVWLSGGGNPCRNLLDFIDGVVDKDGRFHVAFTDGCTLRLSCANNAKATPDESRDRAVALAIQDHGPSLLDGVGLLPTLGWANQVNDPTGSQTPA